MDILDFDDRPIILGTRVCYYQDPTVVGTVVGFTPWDQDADMQDGVYIDRSTPPQVIVQYDDGDTVEYSTCDWEHDVYCHGDPILGYVEEISVVSNA
jgi:hypothetical protein